MFYSREIIDEGYEFGDTYENEMEKWLVELDILSDILSERRPITIPDLRRFDRSLFVGFTNHEIILRCLKSVQNRPEIRQKWVSGIKYPPKYRFGTDEFMMNIYDSYISSAPVKYISNVDAEDLLCEANAILKNGNAGLYDVSSLSIGRVKCTYRGRFYSGVEYLRLLREASLMKNFVLKYTMSRRLLGLHKLIQIVFETSSFCPFRGFPWQQNPILSVLKGLYENFEDFPFREVDGQVLFEKGCSMILPELSFALVELWLKYLLMDMSPEELIVGINIFLEWSQTSMDERLLEFKDTRLNIFKMLVGQTISITGIRHGVKSLRGLIEQSCPEEIWLSDSFKDANDYQEYEVEFFKNAPSALIEYLTKIKVLVGSNFSRTRHLLNLYQIRRLYTVVNLLTQHGLFIKNPVVLTMEKSILPRASITLTPNSMIFMENDEIFNGRLPYQMRWTETPIFSDMWHEGMKLIDRYVEKYDELDLEAEFIKALTNNSGGVDYKPTEQEEVDVPGQILKTFGKKRLMYFLLNPVLYESYSNWIEALKSITTSGERKQVDRRGRVIQMVSNAAQLAPFLLFMLADVMGKSEPELSSKKNSGTIVDINALLCATGNLDCVQESADISGMDASTTRVVTTFVNDILVELLSKCHHERYFFASTHDWKLTNVRSNEDGASLSMRLHPGVEIIKINEAVNESYTYKLNVPELSSYGVKILIDTSAQVFPSGKFSTNAQHSILNMLILRALRGKLISELVKMKINVSQLDCKVSGDDIYASFSTQVRNDGANRLFSSELSKIFTQIGFKIGSLLSRYGATFLQQSALFGTVLPKPDRISLTTSERGDSLKLSTLDAFAEFRDIVKEICSRVHYPRNTKILLFAVGNQMRRVRIDVRQTYDILSTRLSELCQLTKLESMIFVKRESLSECDLPWRMLVGKRYVHVVLPLISLFMSDGFDIPFYAMCFNDYVSRANVFSPRGSVGDWKLRKVVLKKGATFVDYGISERLLRRIEKSSLHQKDVNSAKRELSALSQYIRDDVFLFLESIYDDPLVSFLGFKWMAHFNKFNVKDVLERMRLAKFPRSVREEWANRLTFRLNFDAIVRSRLAGVRLAKAGFNLSNRLAFYNSPIERINQAIVAGGDTTSEFRVHRTELLYHMLDYIGSSWLKTVEYESLLLQDYSLIGPEECKCSSSILIDIGGQLMLSSGVDLDRDLFFFKFGHNFYDLSVQFSGYYALTPGPYKDYKHEELVRFASKVNRDRPDLLHTVWEFANIHHRYRIELERIIRFGELDTTELWKSILHTRQSFEISNSIRHVARLWHLHLLNDRRIERILMTILRDISMAQNDILFRRAKIHLSQAFLLIHGSARVRINSLLNFVPPSSKT